MAIELTRELLSELLRAKTEDIESILATKQVCATEEELARLKFELDRAREHDGEGLSLDELDAVAGGATRYHYDDEGCAATVEYGSNCWGEDGGCDYISNHYVDKPINLKCSCGHYMYKKYTSVRPGGDVGVLACPYCKATREVSVAAYDALIPG